MPIPLYVTVSVCAKDRQQALWLFGWLDELGGDRDHDLLLILPPDGDYDDIIALARAGFGNLLDVIRDRTHVVSDWKGTHNASGANASFQVACRQAEARFKRPWMWLEPDAIPLVPNWLNQIWDAYQRGSKPFMGAMVNIPPACLHMSGNAVYPHDTASRAPKVMQCAYSPWDAYAADEIIPFMHPVNLIQHDWKPAGLEPSFPPLTLDRIHPEAVVYHRCKDGSLIQRLREKKNGHVIVAPKPKAVVPSNKPIGPDIYTYFAPLAGFSFGNEKDLIELWKQEWSRYGWIPHVLGIEDAKKHQVYGQARAIFEKYPSTNPKGYDLHCFLRHLAVDAAGGEWLCDYDVMPATNCRPETDTDVTFYSGNETDPRIPCLMRANPKGWKNIIKHLVQTKPQDMAHWSDMFSFRTFNAPVHRVVVEYGDPDWERGRIIHFPNARMQPAGKTPKCMYIPALLEEARKFHAEELAQTPDGKPLPDRLRWHVKELATMIDGRLPYRAMLVRELRREGLIAAKK